MRSVSHSCGRITPPRGTRMNVEVDQIEPFALIPAGPSSPLIRRCVAFRSVEAAPARRPTLAPARCGRGGETGSGHQRRFDDAPKATELLHYGNRRNGPRLCRPDWMTFSIARGAIQKHDSTHEQERQPGTRSKPAPNPVGFRGALQPACAAHTIDFAKLPER